MAIRVTLYSPNLPEWSLPVTCGLVLYSGLEFGMGRFLPLCKDAIDNDNVSINKYIFIMIIPSYVNVFL